MQLEDYHFLVNQNLPHHQSHLQLEDYHQLVNHNLAHHWDNCIHAFTIYANDIINESAINSERLVLKCDLLGNTKQRVQIFGNGFC